MDEYESLSHTKWDCKYHVVFIPKCRRRTIYGELRPHLGEVFGKLAQQKESRIEEGHLLADHVHMLISIPPKYAVSQVVGFIKAQCRTRRTTHRPTRGRARRVAKRATGLATRVAQRFTASFSQSIWAGRGRLGAAATA